MKKLFTICLLLTCQLMAFAQNEYNPDLPPNPNDASWDEQKGTLMINNFTPGQLLEAIRDAIRPSKYDEANYSKVKSLIVIGEMTQNDWIITNSNFKNLTSFDISRTTGLSELKKYWRTNNNEMLTTLLLPATITSIENGWISGFKALRSITCFATTPPALKQDALQDVPADADIFVPAESLPLYAEADVWKDYNLMPITQGVHSLTVKMPADADMQQYKDMFLELVNTRTGQTRRYVLSNRTQYTFTNLIQGTQYNIYLRNAREDILGSILAIAIYDKNVEVTFPALKSLRDITLQLRTPDGSLVGSDSFTTTWTDAIGNYLATGTTLANQMDGAQAIAKVKLGETLGTQYAQPTDTLFSIGQNSVLAISLTPLQQVTLSGSVTAAATGNPIRGANIAATQQLNGLYPRTITATTDAQGRWTLNVYAAPTEITAQADGYVPQKSASNPSQGGTVDFALPDLTGTVVLLDLSYRPAVRTGDNTSPTTDPVAAAMFGGFDNICYTVYDETHGEELADIVLQGQGLVLQGHDLAEGTRLRITATSPDNLFMPVTVTCAVDANGKASASLPITQLGQLKATFSQTDNSNVVSMLYKGDGSLYGSCYYEIPDEGTPVVSFINLPDGSYTLVTMGESRLFNGINTLEGLTEMRLEEGRDYVKNEVTIQSGRIDSLHYQLIPMMDESVFTYTGENTRFSVSKSQTTVGNFVTLRAQVDFKTDIAPSDIELLFDLPEGCSLVEGSVMAGTQLSTYEVDGNRIAVPLSSVNDQVRFCVVPTVEGYYEPTASVSFNKGWNSITQPIGSVTISADALHIDVPERSANGKLPVSGTALSGALVKVYDDDALIGETEAGPAGTWALLCQLNKPYNLSEHAVYAVITNSDGVAIQTETHQVTVSQGTLTPVVKGTYFNIDHNKPQVVKWDFRNNTVDPSIYGWPTTRTVSWTFAIDFMDGDQTMNDTTVISNVVLHVLRSDNTYVTLDAQYSTTTNRWLAQADFTNTATPANVCVDYFQDDEILMDRHQMDDAQTEIEQSIAETEQLVKDIYALPDEEIVLDEQPLYDELSQLLAIENPDEATCNRITALLENLTDDYIGEAPSEPVDFDVIDASLAALKEWNNQWRDETLQLLSYAVNTDTIAPPKEITEGQYDVPVANGIIRFTLKKVDSINEQELLEEGYNKMALTDGSAIYTLMTVTKESYIDTRIMMQCILEWLDAASAGGGSTDDRLQGMAHRAPSVDDIFDYEEREQLWKKMDQLYEIEKNSPSHTLEGLAQTYVGQGKTLCKELATCSNNLYKSGLSNIRWQVDRLYLTLKDSCEKWTLWNNYTIQCCDYEMDKAHDIKFYFLEPNVRDQILRTVSQCSRIKKDAKAEIKRLEKLRKETEKAYRKIRGILIWLPRTLGASKRDMEVLKWAEEFEDTPIGLLLQLYWGFYESMDVSKDLSGWQDTYNAIKAKLPCNANPVEEQEAQAIFHETIDGILSNGRTEVPEARFHAGRMYYNASDINNIPPGKTPLAFYFTSWKDYNNDLQGRISRHMNSQVYTPLYQYNREQSQLRKSKKQRDNLDRRIAALKCIPNPKPKEDPEPPSTPPTDPKPTNGTTNRVGPNGNMKTNSIYDPSGFVYEAVESNRLEGVVATCFYKETVEDMYGDLHENVAVWDAEKYAQENPLFTDAEGMYHWDVPQGLWQVKYEKEGYETAYSEWLPVPPPQLEVNIGMTQLRQPAVQQVKACTDGIDITFDKYMDPATLTTDNIFVSKGGQTVGGKIELLNADSGYQLPDQQYASKVRFVPATPLTLNDKVQLTVRRVVESYAGLQMEQDFTQEFDVEQRITAIVADSLLYMAEGDTQVLAIQVLPVEAAKGKQLKAVSLNEDVVVVGNNSPAVTLDQNGSATLDVFAASLGSSAIKICLADDDDLQATTLVYVKDPANMFVYMPKASRMSGTEVYRGAEIKLTCKTAGATILYTLDGSCPCDTQSPSVLTYNAPIVATGTELVIRAMAVANGMAESDVAEFRYKVIDNIVPVEPVVQSPTPKLTKETYYRIDGRQTDNLQRGFNIVRHTDGTTQKVVVK